MTDDRGIVRAYSQDRQIYRDTSTALKRKTSTQFQRTSDNYYTNRNCPEILSLFALKHRHLEDREKQIHHSLSNDEHYFNMINYPIQSPSATPIPNVILQTVNQEEKEIKFPKVTPRVTSSSVKKFPTLTPRGTSIVSTKNPIPAIRTSAISLSSSLKQSSQKSKISTGSTETKKKSQQFAYNVRRSE